MPVTQAGRWQIRPWFSLLTGAAKTLFLGAMVLAAPVMAQGLDIPEGGSLNVPPGGTLDLACGDFTIAGDVSLGSGTVSNANDVDIASSGQFLSEAGEVRFGGDWLNQGQFLAVSSTVYAIDDCGAATASFLGSTVFHNLVLASNTGRQFVIPSGSNITVTGELTLQGTSNQPISLTASGTDTAVINLGPDARVQSTHAVVTPGVQIGTSRSTPKAIPTLAGPWLSCIILLTLLTALRQLGGRKQRATDQPA